MRPTSGSKLRVHSRPIEVKTRGRCNNQRRRRHKAQAAKQPVAGKTIRPRKAKQPCPINRRWEKQGRPLIALQCAPLRIIARICASVNLHPLFLLWYNPGMKTRIAYLLLVGAIGLAGASLFNKPPVNVQTARTDPRIADAVERLKGHLRHPESLSVQKTTVLPSGVVEIEFTASGQSGSGRSTFCTRRDEDILPETIEGTRDDPFQIFTTPPETRTP